MFGLEGVDSRVVGSVCADKGRKEIRELRTGRTGGFGESPRSLTGPRPRGRASQLAAMLVRPHRQARCSTLQPWLTALRTMAT